MYTLLYSKWITNNDLLYSTWNSTQCYVPAWMGEDFVGEWIHAESLWSSPETTTYLLIGYTQKKKREKFKVWKKVFCNFMLMRLYIKTESGFFYHPSMYCWIHPCTNIVHVCILILSVLSNSLQPHGLWPARLFYSWDFSGKNTGVGCHFLLLGIFPTQGLNPHLLHWQAYSLSLSHMKTPVLV